LKSSSCMAQVRIYVGFRNVWSFRSFYHLNPTR